MWPHPSGVVACDPYFGNVVLLMGFEGANGSTGAPGMTDESPAAHGVATGLVNATISNTKVEFGSTSLFLNSGRIQYANSNDWNFGAGNFTLELWVNFNSLAGIQRFISTWNGTNDSNLGFTLGMTSAGTRLTWEVSTTGINGFIDINAVWAPVINQWYFITLDYNGTTYRAYVNGTMIGSSTTARTIFNSTHNLNIGSDNDGSSPLLGYMDELRITKGVARYASDGVAWTSRNTTTQVANISDLVLSSIGSYAGAISLTSDPSHANWTDIILEIKSATSSPPTFVNAGAMTSATTAPSGIPALPVSRTNGNLLIAYCRSNSVANTLSVSAGWTIGYSTRQGNTRPSIVAYAYVTGSETAPTFTSSVGSDNFYAQVLQYAGAVSSSPFGNSSVGWFDGTTGFDGGSNAPMRCPQMLSAFSNSTALNIALINPLVTAAPSTPTNPAFAVPTAAFPRVACPTAWNPADQSANIILSNSNLTATISTGATDNAVRSTKSHATSGKYYAEFTANFGAAPGADTGVGIATSTAVLTSVGATSTNALLCYVSGNIYFNGSFTTTNVGSGINTGVICMAIDLDNKTSWFRLNNGPWNNPNAGANPATNTGGNSISAVFSGSTAAYAIFTANYNANVPAITANFGATAFSFAVPSGFVAWG